MDPNTGFDIHLYFLNGIEFDFIDTFKLLPDSTDSRNKAVCLHKKNSSRPIQLNQASSLRGLWTRAGDRVRSYENPNNGRISDRSHGTVLTSRW
ncbi:hypothetical protein K2173_004956 [Erythroxylum novogranatense]|uniref:Uncharacterized protein n=1 Tax=Erythroxylum novogranatense TaxID=1862640 RepID=A0AAV8TB46_9ROSI|nr:hypothetical protein K2173_004956 [Erythroxylum novogranatense]